MRWKTYNHFVTNLFRILPTKFYQNRPSFIEDMTQTFRLTFFLRHGVFLSLRRYAYFRDSKSRLASAVLASLRSHDTTASPLDPLGDFRPQSPQLSELPEVWLRA